MGRSQQTWNKKEREKKKQEKREEKEKKKEARKEQPVASGLDNMLAYVDEYGNITSTPPDPEKKEKIIAENIEVGVPKKESIKDSDIERTGIVKFFNESKGYGFITDSETNESVFVHINGLLEPIKENNRVTYKVEQGKKGLNAINVKLVK